MKRDRLHPVGALVLACACWTWDAPAAMAGCPHGFDPLTGECIKDPPQKVPEPPTLHLTSEPPGAEIFEVQRTGRRELEAPTGQRTPVSLRMKPGPHTFVLRLPQHAPAQADVVVKPAGKTSLAVSLRSFPRITVKEANNEPGTLWVDGQRVGPLPIIDHLLPMPGPHELRVLSDGFEEELWPVDYPCPQGSVETTCWPDRPEFVIDLVPKPGELTIGHQKESEQEPGELVGLSVELIRPGGTRESLGSTPIKPMKLPPGDYTLRILLRDASDKRSLHQAADPTGETWGGWWNAWRSHLDIEAKIQPQGKHEVIPKFQDLFSTARFVPSGPPGDASTMEDALVDRCVRMDVADACVSLAYLHLHGRLSERRDYGEALKYYREGCKLGSARACLGASYVLRVKPGLAPDSDQATVFTARACAMQDSRDIEQGLACWYAYAHGAPDPTQYIDVEGVQPSRFLRAGYLELYGLGALNPVGSFRNYVDAGYSGHLGFMQSWLLTYISLGLRFRTFEQRDASTQKVEQIFRLGYGVEGGVLFRIAPAVTGISLRFGGRYNGYFNDIVSSVGGLASVGWFWNVHHVELGALYEQTPLQAITIKAFENEHTIGSRDFVWLGFLRYAYLIKP
ncbi:hypothetical protein WME94_48575 [Sorangium sp. So ce429]